MARCRVVLPRRRCRAVMHTRGRGNHDRTRRRRRRSHNHHWTRRRRRRSYDHNGLGRRRRRSHNHHWTRRRRRRRRCNHNRSRCNYNRSRRRRRRWSYHDRRRSNDFFDQMYDTGSEFQTFIAMMFVFSVRSSIRIGGDKQQGRCRQSAQINFLHDPNLSVKIYSGTFTNSSPGCKIALKIMIANFFAFGNCKYKIFFVVNTISCNK